jgi:hypothetical protein
MALALRQRVVTDEDIKLVAVCAVAYLVLSTPALLAFINHHSPISSNIGRAAVNALILGVAVVVVMKIL